VYKQALNSKLLSPVMQSRKGFR